MGQQINEVNEMHNFPIVEKLKKERMVLIPYSFYESLEDFCERNFIEIEVNNYGKKRMLKKVCLACVKAFMMEQGAKVYHSLDIIRLASKINEKIGHLNYYLDRGVPKKVETHL